MGKLLTGLLLLILVMTNSACPDMSSSYGLFVVESPNGEKLYFRREARGLNYDSLSLSQNQDYCSEPDASSDFIFAESATTLFYKFEGNELHIYLTVLAKTPSNFSAETKVVQHKLNNLEFLAIKENYKNKGLELLDVSLNEMLTCK